MVKSLKICFEQTDFYVVYKLEVRSVRTNGMCLCCIS